MKTNKGKIILFAVVLFFGGVTFLNCQTVQDVEGNIYPTITIGKQVWMGANLKSTKYNDGKQIPLVADEKAWEALKTPAYCWFNNDIKNKEISGALYNWYTVNTKKLCPKGWHVPSDVEWQEMIDLLGDAKTAGDKLKEAGVEHWKNYLSTASNDFDFTAIPGGMRYFAGNFPLFGDSYAIWWASSELSQWQGVNRGLHDSSSRIYKASDNKRSGFSVRCIKDR